MLGFGMRPILGSRAIMISFGLRLVATTLWLWRARPQQLLPRRGFFARHLLELLGKPIESAVDLVQGAAGVN
jgi:hypothetical protein